MITQILNRSKQLVSIPSTKENTQALHDVLEIAKKELADFTIEELEKDGIPSLLVYKEKTRPKKFKVILNGHLDVVPGKKDQFKPHVKDGKLYGRGTYDMKAAAAVMILVFKEIANTVDYPLGLQLVTDEEVGGFKATKHQVESGVDAEFVIAGEMTDFQLKNKAKGILWTKIITSGTSAHGAYPWLGENAVTKMHQVLSHIFQKYPTPLKEDWVTTINLAKIETTNATFNKVPDDCTAWLDIRYIPEDKENILSALKEIIGVRGELHIQLMEPSFYTDPANKYILSLQKNIQEVSPHHGEIKHAHGASDLRHYAPIGAGGVEFGPIGYGMHTNDEWVDIQSLQDYYSILKKFLQGL